MLIRKVKLLFAFAPATLLIFGGGGAIAGDTMNEAGVLALVTDKWNETEPEKGHKLVDYAGRYVAIPTNTAEPKNTGDCVGKYEYMPDESWKGSGTCTVTFEGGDTLQETFEEGSHLKEYVYKYTGGTGKYEGASGGGTYTSKTLTDTLGWGQYKGTIQLP
jgi:hypothetical protein